MVIGGFRKPSARAHFDAAYDAGLKALPAPTGQHDIATGFGTVRVYQFGPTGGSPVVALPGRSGTALMWQPNLAALSTHHPVYALDTLGEAGRSHQTHPIRDDADQAAWLEATLAGLALTGVHLVGVSFGGWLAVNLAVRAPARVASLSLLDPALTFGGYPPSLIWRTALAFLPVVSRWGRPAFMRWLSGGEQAPPDDPVATVIDAAIADFRIALPTPRVFTDGQLRGITVPTLALIAGRSVIHDPQRAYERARRLMPAMQAELWADATHAISGEHADRVNQTVLAFIDRIDASQAA